MKKIQSFIKEPVESILDVGCNVGAWLADCKKLYPDANLVGVEINKKAIEVAKSRLPEVKFYETGAEKLPFDNNSFQYVTCIEVLEHLPSELRPVAFREIHRVLRPGGTFILTVPHAGCFAWLDSNNIRFRIPLLYKSIIRQGNRDDNYKTIGREVEWHYHFKSKEIEQLAGEGWDKLSVSYGGLFIYPIMDWLSWPFYRLGLADNPIRKLFERLAGWDYRIDFGKCSYGIMAVFRKK